VRVGTDFESGVEIDIGIECSFLYECCVHCISLVRVTMYVNVYAL
jgi:hypothetical protein